MPVATRVIIRQLTITTTTSTTTPSTATEMRTGMTAVRCCTIVILLAALEYTAHRHQPTIALLSNQLLLILTKRTARRTLQVEAERTGVLRREGRAAGHGRHVLREQVADVCELHVGLSMSLDECDVISIDHHNRKHSAQTYINVTELQQRVDEQVERQLPEVGERHGRLK